MWVFNQIIALFVEIHASIPEPSPRWFNHYFDNSISCTYHVNMIDFDDFDDFAVQFFDQEHAPTEDQFLSLGLSNETNLLIVYHCERDDGNIISVISARKATKNESKHYQRGH